MGFALACSVVQRELAADIFDANDDSGSIHIWLHDENVTKFLGARMGHMDERGKYQDESFADSDELQRGVRNRGIDVDEI